MLLVLVHLASAAPLSECSRSYDNSTLTAAIAAADRAIAAVDAGSLLAGRDTLLERLACAADPLPPAVIGGVHRIVATAASVERQEVRIAPALASLLAADPGYQLPPELYSPSNPVRLSLAHAGLLLREGLPRPLRTPAAGWLEVDGASATATSTTRPSIVQALDGNGVVVETRYLWPDDPLGTWAPAAPVAAVASREATSPAPKAKVAHPHRAPLLAATIASAVATGVLYGIARADRDSFDDRSIVRSDAELATLRDETNGLTVGWTLTGVAALGLGATVAITW